MPTINVATEAQLRDAIFTASNDFAIDGVVADDYVINITADLTGLNALTQSLPMIRGDGIHTITVNGNGFTIDAASNGRVFFVESGKVEITDVTMVNALAHGGDGGDGTGGGGGGGLGAGAAVFVNAGATVTLSDVAVGTAVAVGGTGGEGVDGTGSGGGGGGGLGGDGGDGGFGAGGGGGGYEGTGGAAGDPGDGGGGGGEFGDGGGGGLNSGGGGGGQQGNGGTGSDTAGGGGGGATADGGNGSGTTGGAGGSPEGGDGGNEGENGDPGAALGGGGGGGLQVTGVGASGGAGGDSGGGGGAGQASFFTPGVSGGGGVGGGAGGGRAGTPNPGGDFGGGGGNGGTASSDGGDAGFGGGGGGTFADDGVTFALGGRGGFGGGGGGATDGSSGGIFAGTGGAGAGADGGGGAALGGAIFVRDGGTLIVKNSSFAGAFNVDGGDSGGTGGATGGEAHGNVMFLHGSAATTFEIDEGNTTTIGEGTNVGAGSIAGDGVLTKTGAGTLVLDGANTYSGGTTIDGGVLNVGHADALGTGTLTVLGSTLEIQDKAPSNIYLSNSVDLHSDLTVNFVNTVGGGSGGLTGAIDDTGGAFGIIKTGDGILALSGNNGYAGATNIIGGTLRAAGSNAIGDLSAVNVGTGTLLELFFSGEAIGSLSGSGGVGNFGLLSVPLTFGHNNGDATFSGVFGFNLSLVKVGTGKQVLSGLSSSFGGGITVNGGTLQVDGALVDSISTVNAGATLAGNGSVGEVNVAAGGTLAPGASAGILTTGSITLVAGASFEAEIGGTSPGIGGYDQLKVTGIVALSGATLDASLIGGFVPTYNARFTFIENDGTDAISGIFAGLAEGAVVNVGGTEMLITYKGGDGNDVVLLTGVIITGTSGSDLVDATHTVAGQSLPTAPGDLIKGKRGEDDLSGLGGDDTILGNRGRDTLDGGEGNDWLKGGAKSDTLTGGEGDDTFVFANHRRPDKITDFSEGDIIALLKNALPGIGPKGVLKAKYFHAGLEAETPKQKILYDEESGWLLYAKHGSNNANALALARIGTNLEGFDHTDILVI